jgi:membrane protein implicated in regulation of membrane protease activity
MTARLEGAWLWLVIAAGATAGVVVFGIEHEWIGFAMFAVATLLALMQLLRIFIRTYGGGSGRRY